MPNALKPLSLHLRFYNMRKYFYLVTFFLMPFILLSQEASKDKKAREKERIFFEGSIGVSVPIGQYMKDDTNSKKAGFAQPGYLIQVTCDWMGKKDFGLALQYTYQNNPIKSSAQTAILPERTFPLGSGSWSNHYILAGPVYYRELGKFTLNGKLLGGVMFAFSPLFNYTSPDSTLRTVKNYGSGFAYQVAFGCGYSLSSKVKIQLSLSFLGAIPTFKKKFGGEYLGKKPEIDPETGEPIKDPYTGLVIYYDVYAPWVLFDLKYVISTVNASVGIIFKL